jgi:hypothetical protein
MRPGEYVNLACFLFLVGLALFRPLPRSRRAHILVIGALGMLLIGAAVAAGRLLPPLAGSVTRDWIPAILLLMVYWQAGQFFVQPRESLQLRLLQMDRKLLDPALSMLARGRAGRWVATYLELAYLLCYALVPLGLGALYLLHSRPYADRFWIIVLLPTCLCYVMVPFFQTLPPRILEPDREHSWHAGRVRSLNLWILQHGSIHANTLPSAHVAASAATGLALFQVAPSIGFLFLWLALSIACGAAIGRYHYAADVILGALLALVTFSLCR